MLKGKIPILDEQYDLTGVDGATETGSTVVTGAVGFAMLFGMAAIGRYIWNQTSQVSDRVDQVEVF